ncbi:hypothetical protein HMI54_000641 [Coelomomyces lativittatus]|nr:hypothetical protein HMI56_001055 [Coelomomyces lativittatus]KAJ1511640.1 hypothetical protein HMI54_000641 [Coelomomyces lativittatus]
MDPSSLNSSNAVETTQDYYFDSYAHFGIHEEMLKDEVRTVSYRNAILHNKHLFKDKVVLDVGCGTGILSMFASQAGARLVIGVDNSNIIQTAQTIVKDNGFQNITLIQGTMETVTLPVDQVDIIISEWMGYFLLYESMLDTVIYARDRYLKSGGMMFPDRATLHVALLEDAEYKQEKIGYWDNVYGFDFRAIKDQALTEPLVDTVDAKHIVSDAVRILDLDLNTVKVNDLAFVSSFSLIAQRDDYVQAIVAWFDISFTCIHKPIYFTTSPRGKYTHWKQTVFYLTEDLPMKAGQRIQGTLSCEPNKKNHRNLDIILDWHYSGEYEYSEKQHYRMC